MKNTRIVKRFRKGKGIRRAVKTPAFLLKWKGKRDAKKGISVAQAYIRKAKARCLALENREVLTAEGILCPLRKEAAGLLAAVRQDKKTLGMIPAHRQEDTAEDVRANRQNAQQRMSTATAIKSCLERLVQIHELIVDIDTCLGQRLMKTRSLCSEKLSAYCIGIREVISDFDMDIVYDDAPISRYEQKHNECDTAIANVVSSIYAKEE